MDSLQIKKVRCSSNAPDFYSFPQFGRASNRKFLPINGKVKQQEKSMGAGELSFAPYLWSPSKG
jgi:hypothetical protein